MGALRQVAHLLQRGLAQVNAVWIYLRSLALVSGSPISSSIPSKLVSVSESNGRSAWEVPANPLWYEADAILRRARAGGHSLLLIIWLLQQAPMGSVEGWPDRRFPRRFASFRPTSPQSRLASSIWRHAVGRMALLVRGAGTKQRMNWRTKGATSAPNAGTRFR